MDSFETELINLFDKYYDQNSLTVKELNFTLQLCEKYNVKLKSKYFTFKVLEYCEMYNLDIKNITIYNYNKYTNSTHNVVEFNVTIDNNKYYFIFEEIRHDNSNKKYYKFIINENIIFKKNNENNENNKSYINLSYIKDILETNKINISEYNFIKIFTFVFDTYHIYSHLLELVKEDNNKYYFDLSWTSDSDISDVDFKEIS